MTTLMLEKEPAAAQVEAANAHLSVTLIDGRTLIVPLEWYPRLLHGTPAERANCEIIGEGYGIQWPDLDEHLSVEGLLAGRRSGESEKSFQRWLDAREKPE